MKSALLKCFNLHNLIKFKVAFGHFLVHKSTVISPNEVSIRTDIIQRF